MNLPDNFGPDENATSDQIEHWLRQMVRWRLLTKQYMVQNGEGDWYYQDTWLSKWIVLPVLNLYARLRGK